MLSREEIETLKNFNEIKMYNEEYENAMSIFSKNSAETAERFENIIDDSFRDLIKKLNSPGPKKKSATIVFKTSNIFQIAALAHIITKYKNEGFKVTVMEKSTKKYENEYSFDKSYNSIIDEIFYRRRQRKFPQTEKEETTFQPSSKLYAITLKNYFNDIIMAMTRKENFYLDLTIIGGGNISNKVNITAKDILLGANFPKNVKGFQFLENEFIQFLKLENEYYIEFSLDE